MFRGLHPLTPITNSGLSGEVQRFGFEVNESTTIKFLINKLPSFRPLLASYEYFSIIVHFSCISTPGRKFILDTRHDNSLKKIKQLRLYVRFCICVCVWFVFYRMLSVKKSPAIFQASVIERRNSSRLHSSPVDLISK